MTTAGAGAPPNPRALVGVSMPHQGVGILMALSGSLWAAFLIPPQLVAWAEADAPAWAVELSAEVPAYAAIRSAALELGIDDDYALFGGLIALSFLLVGLALLTASRHRHDIGRGPAWLCLAGAPIALLSYSSHDLGMPWQALWGAEGVVLLLIGAAGLAAGIRAWRRPDTPRWWAGLLAATLPVIVAGIALLGYWPHGALVTLGVEAAALAAGSRSFRD